MRGLVVVALVGLLALAFGAWLFLGDPGTLGVPAEVAAGPSRGAATLPEEQDATLRGVDRAQTSAGEEALGARTELVVLPDAGESADTDGKDEQGGIRLTGRAVDRAGMPLAGAHVFVARSFGWPGPPLDSRFYESVSWGDRRQGWTAADGRFAFEGVQRGAARLAVRAAGFAPLDLGELQVDVRDEQDLGDLALVPGVVLSGRVVDPGGAPVAGAELVRLDEGSLFLLGGLEGARGAVLATSGADGAFRVDTLAPGRWRLLVTSPDHPDLLAEGEAEAAGREVGGLVLRLERGLAISGRVEAPEGTDWSQLRVRAARPGGHQVDVSTGRVPWREADCRPDGSFTVGGLAQEGLHVLRVIGRAPGPRGGERLSDPVEAPSGARDVVLTLAAPVEFAFRAVDAASSEPLEDLGFELLEERDGEVSSEAIDGDDERMVRDAQGTTTVRCTLQVGADSRARVRLSARGHRPWTSQPVQLVGGQRVDLGQVALEPRPVLLVRVVTADGGLPIEDATVSLCRDETQGAPGPDLQPPHGRAESVRTDAAGLARVPRIEGGSGLLSASHAGFAPGEELLVSLDAALASATEPAFELRLARGGAVEVAVVDPLGAPAPGVDVTQTGPEQESPRASTRTTDVQGLALFEHLPAGTQRFEVAAPQGRGLILSFPGEASEAGDARSRGEVVVTEGGRARLTLVRPAQGRLLGRITEAGQPLAGAGLRLEPTGAPAFVIPGLTDQPWTHTDGSGRYAVEPLRAGRYELVIRHRARVMDARVAVTIVEGDNPLDVDLASTGIEGRVSDATGRPLAGAEVRVRPAGEGSAGHRITFLVGSVDDDAVSMSFGGADAPATRTGPDGLYRLHGVTPDVELIVTATHPDHRTSACEPFQLAPGVLRTGVDLVLGPAGRLEVVARTSAGQSLRELQVVATWAGAEEQVPEDVSGSTDASGAVMLTGLAPGPWTVLAQPAGWDEEALARIVPRQVTVVAGEQRRVELALP